ncbi:MAG: hypothetical protein KGI71_02505 [Patescibacteria group bacterium]|nr:hypothetical protein [Patescibacteria group bacterium]
MRSSLLRTLAFFVALLAPAFAFAHEVYVLPQDAIRRALQMPAFSEWQTIFANLNQFLFWGFIAALLIFIVFFVSISRRLERLFGPFLAKLPPYAPVITRVTIGIALIAASYHQALFGPELPLSATFGAYTSIATAFLLVIGLMITFGFYARIAALVAFSFFGIELWAHGIYMLTYANYLGELILLLILGAHQLSFHNKHHDAERLPGWIRRVKKKFAPYAFLVLRITFGISLFYASFYAKILHNNLALMVASLPLAGHTSSLAQVFGFEPHFLVLGAAIVEILIAAFFILGIEIRFTSLFLLFWLSLSLLYFGEAVWPHVVLIGIPIAFIFYGYDKYSLEGRFFKRGGREPVL